MKNKNKMLAMGKIVMMPCPFLVVTLPMIAAEQNQEMQKASASEVKPSFLQTVSKGRVNAVESELEEIKGMLGQSRT